MSSESTVEDILIHLNEIHTGVSEGTSSLFRDSIVNALRLQLKNNPASQETLNVCLLIGLNYIQTPSQQLFHRIAAVGELVQFGAKWDGCTLFLMDKTPYHIICQCHGDHHDVLNLMINSFENKSLSVQDSSGCTAMMYAVHNKNFGCLRCLITHGAKWDSSTLFLMDKTPYHIICQCPGDHHDVLNLMITSFGKESLKVQDSSGCTAVMYAVHNKNFECLRCLIAHGVKWDSSTLFHMDKTPYHIICQCPGDHYDVLNLMIKSFGKESLKVQDSSGCTAVMYAVHTRNFECLRCLIAHRVKWDNSTLFHMDKTPYHIICQCPGDHHDVLNLMIKSFGKESLNVQDSSGCTAVMYAVHNRNFECLRCLIAHGADLNLGNDMTTPLIYAIRAHSESPYSTCVTRDIVNLLLESGVDVNQPCYQGDSPIKHAIKHNNIYCVRKLVQNSAEFYLCQLWLYAATNKNINVLGYLLELRVDKNCIDLHGRNVLWHAVNVGDITVLGFLLEAGVTIASNVKHQYDLIRDMRTAWSKDITYMDVKHNATQWNPCMLAIALEKLDVAQLFEKYDQDAFQSIEYLKCAVRNNSLTMVKYLLSKYTYSLNMEYPHKCGSNSSKTYQTILTEACKPHQLEMVSLLMDYGAEPAKKSYHRLYQSAFRIAIENEYNELVAHFIRSGVSLDCRLHDEHYGAVLPFEYALQMGNKQAAEMLLHAGFSFGKFKLNDKIVKKLIRNSSPEIQKLMIMIEWNVHENNVQSLHQLSRTLILNHLCPGAAKKITELPLSPMIIRYLSIPELDKELVVRTSMQGAH